MRALAHTLWVGSGHGQAPLTRAFLVVLVDSIKQKRAKGTKLGERGEGGAGESHGLLLLLLRWRC